MDSFAVDPVETEVESFAWSPQLKTETAKKRRAHSRAAGTVELRLLSIIFPSCEMEPVQSLAKKRNEEKPASPCVATGPWGLDSFKSA